MTLAGWAFMLISIVAVLLLVSFCYYKVLTTTKTTNCGDEQEAVPSSHADNCER